MEEITDNFSAKKDKRIFVRTTKDETVEVTVCYHKHTINIASDGEQTYYYLDLKNEREKLFFAGWVRKEDVEFFRESINYID